ncbi:MAG: amino acid ABC transporter substrate-binding protein, partial [Anaerolineae bacterium]|nr:amino acid ABC transporter substrate-binding protein [Anaerolineae bacterium]
MRNKMMLVLSCLVMVAAGLCACVPTAPTATAPTKIAPTATAPAAPAPTSTVQAPTAPPTEPPASATPQPVAQDDWERVQATGVLRVGCPLDNPPFNMYNADFQPDGFDVALMTEVAQRLGLKVEFNNFAFDGLLGALQLQRIDAVIAAMAITDERQAVADFTRSYYQGEDVILAAANSPITLVATRADVAQRRVGVQRGTVYESWLLRNLVQAGEMPASNLQAYSQPADAVAALDQGRVDLVIMDREAGLAVVVEGKAKPVGKSLYVQDYAVAVRKGSA